jgi:hypothetical protein
MRRKTVVVLAKAKGLKDTSVAIASEVSIGTESTGSLIIGRR